MKVIEVIGEKELKGLRNDHELITIVMNKLNELINDRNSKIKKKATIRPTVDAYGAFIDFFNELTKRKFGYSDKKAKKQFEYLRKQGYDRKKFKKIILNAYEDKYHKENNYKYLTPEFITRTDKAERYLAMPDPVENTVSEIKTKSLDELIGEQQKNYK